MLKKVAVIGGIVAVAGLGLGGAAWAESNSTAPQAVAASAQGAAAAPAVATATTSVAPTTAGKGTAGKGARARAKADRAGKRSALIKRLEKVSHAQWVSKNGKTGTFVTHDAVRGDVISVSAGSITVKAADGTTETFTVNSATKVHVKGAAKGTAGTITQVKVGDAAGVIGTGAGTMTATHVIDRGSPKAKVPAAATAPTTS